MKKFFLLTAALVSGLMAQAQQKIVTLGFEDGDATHTTEWALTPGGMFGDLVNVKEGDSWVEQAEEAAHSGKYGLYVMNGDAVEGQQWQRGFKIGHLPVKDNTSYRVSFWIKADSRFKSSISIGREYFDNELQSPVNKTSYNYNWDNPTGEWQRVSYVTFNTNKAFLDDICRSRYGEGDVIIAEDNESVPEEWRGKVVGNGAEGFPENSYFVIINMYNPGEYMLDDITVEEGVTVNGCTYSDVAVKIDFGYPTNIAALANAHGGMYSIPTSCVTVQQGGQTFEIEYLEAASDGFLYAFFPDGVGPDENATDPVIVTFTPDSNCPIVYNTDKRPSADTESEMVVFGFQNEVAYYDDSIDILSPAWKIPTLLSTTPENESFELDNAFGKIVFTYDTQISLDFATATLESNGVGTDWSKNMSLSEDGCSIVFTFDRLNDGEYTLRVNGVANAMGDICENDQVMVFSVGIDMDDTESEEIYCPDWSDLANGTFPKGWVSNDNGTIHEYGLTENGQVWNYNWGGNPGGGGCRAMTGYSGDFNGGAMYWRNMDNGGQLGMLTYGEQVVDYLYEDGTADPDMDEDIALYLEPKKYQISFKMAAWKFMNENTVAPRYNFELTDLQGNVYAQFTDFEAKPNVNGAQNMEVKGATNNVADFTVSEPGYYVLRFSSTQPGAELLMGNLRLITMPSKAAYYRHLLEAAREEAEDVLYEAWDDEELYGGSTMDALEAEIAYSKDARFHSPSEVYAEIEKLQALAAALRTRMGYIDVYDTAIADAMDGISELEGTKYMNVDVVAEVAAIIAQHGNTEANQLSDEELARVTPILSNAVAKLSNVQHCTDILTWGLTKAAAAYETLGGEEDYVFESVEKAVSDDRELANAINNVVKYELYKQIVAGTWNQEENLSMAGAYEMINLDDETAVAVVEGDSIVGIELTGFVANPKLYRVNGDNGVPGWDLTSGSESKNTNISWGGDTPTDARYVSDMFINIYGDATYDLSQTIENLPVGKYIVEMATRTPLVDKLSEFEKIFYYNAQDEEGTWDKYIYANTAAENKVAPYLGGTWSYGGAETNNTVIREVVVGKDEALTIGFHENYVSGKAMKHEDNTEQGAWTGTTFADDVHIYFVAPLEGFDYAAEVAAMETALDTVKPNAAVVDIYSLNGVRLNKVQKGVNILKMSNGKVVKVVVK